MKMTPTHRRLFMQVDNMLALPPRITARQRKEKAPPIRLKGKERQDSGFLLDRATMHARTHAVSVSRKPIKLKRSRGNDRSHKLAHAFMMHAIL
jgi:hypothetical protein